MLDPVASDEATSVPHPASAETARTSAAIPRKAWRKVSQGFIDVLPPPTSCLRLSAHRAEQSRPAAKLAKLLMVGKISCGLLMYRVRRELEVLLVHLGGPFWAKKDQGAWFIPKGEMEPGEEALAAALREFEEETGLRPMGPFQELGAVKHKSGKTVLAWAFQGDWDTSSLKSNTFSLEWPPRSGRFVECPEVDRAQFFTVEEAEIKVHPVELALVERLRQIREEGAR